MEVAPPQKVLTMLTLLTLFTLLLLLTSPLPHMPTTYM